MRVLTVGDGDLSYSLALQRAFGGTIQLTATVLPTNRIHRANPTAVPVGVTPLSTNNPV